MFLSSPPTDAVIFHIPDGPAGTRQTLKLMARLVKDARAHPAIRHLSTELIQHCEAQAYSEEVRACFFYVRDSIRYTMDTNGMEHLQNPVILLDTRAGDCDDKATLLAAMLESIGHPCRFVALGYTAPGEFEHVYVETRIGADWIPCETTPINGRPVDLGFAPVPPMVPDAPVCVMKEHI